jgi:hypothetical protein
MSTECWATAHTLDKREVGRFKSSPAHHSSAPTRVAGTTARSRASWFSLGGYVSAAGPRQSGLPRLKQHYVVSVFKGSLNKTQWNPMGAVGNGSPTTTYAVKPVGVPKTLTSRKTPLRGAGSPG